MNPLATNQKMTSGYKQLYSCITFIIFLVVVNFYKNKIQQAREREAFVRAKTRGNIPSIKHPMQAMKAHPVAMFDGEDGWFLDPEGGQWADGALDNQESVLERMKEFPDQCKDMEVFYFAKDLEKEGNDLEPPVGSQKKTNDARQEPKSNSSTYMFLSVLMILLIAAGVDIAKHVRDIPRQDNIRRLSLQNYQALIREKQKQFRMMKHHYSQPSISINRSIDESNYPMPSSLSGKDEPEIAVGGAATKPAPLLRRQSVPAMERPLNPLGLKNLPTYPKQLYRRPSVDSFGLCGTNVGIPTDRDTTDFNTFLKANNGSPTEMRRRVRMLHRH